MSNKLNVFVCSFQERAESYTDPSVKDRIKIQNIFAEKLQNGFLSVSINWESNSDNRYVVEGPTTFGYAESSVTLHFPNINYSYKNQPDLTFPAFIEVGFELLDESDALSIDEPIQYTYLFMVRGKYYVRVYFAPKNWNDGQSEVLLDVNDPVF